MRRDAISRAVRAAGVAALERASAARRAAAAVVTGDGAGRAWATVRRRPDAVLVAGVVVGVLVMILHWS